jgi:putative redox protein
MIRARNEGAGYCTSFTNGHSTGIADMPIAKGGNGEGFGPHDLVEAALATCIVITARKHACEHQLPLRTVQCEVRIDRSIAGAVTLHYQLSLAGGLTAAQEQGLRDAVSRCPVARTLTGEVALRPSV